MPRMQPIASSRLIMFSSSALRECEPRSLRVYLNASAISITKSSSSKALPNAMSDAFIFYLNCHYGHVMPLSFMVHVKPVGGPAGSESDGGNARHAPTFPRACLIDTRSLGKARASLSLPDLPVALTSTGRLRKGQQEGFFLILPVDLAERSTGRPLWTVNLGSPDLGRRDVFALAALQLAYCCLPEF